MLQQDRILAGILLRLGSAAAFGAMNALIKLAEAGGAHLGEIMFFRQTCALPLVTLWIARTAGLPSIRTTRIGSHATRTVIGLTSMVFTFWTILLLPLAEATTLNFTVPIFATILGALVLREPTGRHRWGAVVAGFIGVLIVAQPGSGDIPLLGAATGLAAALLTSIVSILLRQLSQTEPPATIVWWFSALSVPPLGIAMLLTATPHPAMTWVWLVLLGLAGGCGQLCMTASLKAAPVSVVVPMDYSGLLWATFWGWALFAVLPGWSTLAGAPVIIASGLYIVWREQRRRQENTERVGAGG